jgi:uncharacterized protein (DUF1330 family)
MRTAMILRKIREQVMNTKYTMTFAMLLSFALGAAAVHVLHAQVKPPAFFIAENTVTNQEGYTKEFLPPVTKSILDGGGKFIARAGKTVSYLGAPPAPRVIVIQFESLDKAQAWMNSSSNKSAQAIGDKYATFRGYAVEGVSP